MQIIGKHPTAKEIKLSFLLLMENIQSSEDAKEIEKLKQGKLLSSNLQRLSPFIHVLKLDTRKCSLIHGNVL